MSKQEDSDSQPTPFDPAYTQLFSYPKMVRDLLVNFVKQPWVNDIDWDSLHTLSPKFVTKKLRKRESDIIWTAKWQDKDLYIILFLEFQSSVDRFMPVRILAYVNLLFLQLVKEGKITDKLPPVLPLVLYNG
ncbi:Rpn family recombination-promoting nuclease/putative transposase, partial [Pseudobacteriovorax antillogorgiicola]